MKKILSAFLVVLLLLSNLAMHISATEPEQGTNEIANIAPNGIPYCTSEKNSLWTPAKSMINGLYGTDDWHGWECAYPEVTIGQDTSNGFSGEFCGIKFEQSYYEISEIKMNIGLHTLCGGQNATYTIQALVDGKWQQIAVLKDEEAVPTSDKYADYNAVMSDPNASHRVNANLNVSLLAPVTTNNIRILISDYAKNYEGGDVLIFPFIYELELYGKKGIAPEIILPEGASISTDVAWHAYPSAKEGSNGTYPFLAIDNDDTTYWELDNYQGGEYFTLMLDNEYEIGSVKLLLERTGDKRIQNTVLEYYYDGKWQTDYSLKPGLERLDNDLYILDFEFPAMLVSGVRIKFRTPTGNLRLYAFEVHLKDTKIYSFENRFTQAQLVSGSNGNLSIIGKPYSSTSFNPYSDNSYINDGLSSDSKVWFTGELNTPEHCGIRFTYPQKISKATVSVRPSTIDGREIMRLEIQALVNGEYVTIARGKSYDGDYQTEYTFKEIETTDIRVVITEANGAIPNVMELELYSDSVLPMLSGIRTKDEPTVEPEQKPQETPKEEKSNGVSMLYMLPLLVAVIIAIISMWIAINNNNKKANTKEQNNIEQKAEQNDKIQEIQSPKAENKAHLKVECSQGKRHFLKKQ